VPLLPKKKKGYMVQMLFYTKHGVDRLVDRTVVFGVTYLGINHSHVYRFFLQKNYSVFSFEFSGVIKINSQFTDITIKNNN